MIGSQVLPAAWRAGWFPGRAIVNGLERAKHISEGDVT